MNLNKLKAGIKATVVASGLCLFIMGCNDDQSVNNSTTGANESGSDTSAVVNNTTATRPVAKKRTGKASAAIVEEKSGEKMEMDKQGVYNNAEIVPVYNGGQIALENYIVDNIQYPQDAIDNNVEGTVRVRFAVDEKGNVSNVSTIGDKLGFGLEDEAIRIVSNMPKWTPGQVKGKKVITWRTLPITYKLEG